MKQTVFIFLVVIMALLPIWPYSQGWGYISIAWVCLLAAVLWSLRKLRVI